MPDPKILEFWLTVGVTVARSGNADALKSWSEQVAAMISSGEWHTNWGTDRATPPAPLTS